MMDERTRRFDLERADDTAFAAYHAENPLIYETLLRFAREAQAAGRTRIGIKMLYERARWYSLVEARHDSFKLNNNYHASYSRLLTRDEPELAGLFELRKSKADATLPVVGMSRKGR